MTLNAQAAYIFKKNFCLGSLVLGLGLFLFTPSSLSFPILLAYSLLGGWVIGSCFRLMMQNTLLSSIHFYEHMLKFRIESGRFSHWRYLLLKRLILTLVCIGLVWALLCLPVLIQLAHQSVSFIYIGIIMCLYARMGKFVTIQLRAWKIIKERALEVEALLDQEQQEREEC